MPRGIYTRKSVRVIDQLAPKEFTEALIAGFNEPAKASKNVQQVIDMYTNELATLEQRKKNLEQKVEQLKTLQEMLENHATEESAYRKIA